MAITYTDVPALAQWKTDSSVTLARRESDVLLKRIDTLVQTLEEARDQAAQQYLSCELFFVLDYWLKTLSQGGNVEKGRRPAVQALYECVVKKLCEFFKVTVNVLPRELENCFGRELGDHGAKLDQEWDCAKYLTRADVVKYRLWFRNGRAYQLPWWKSKKSPKGLVLADSSHAHVGGMFEPGYGGFAMSMGRDIYMAKHFCGKGLGGFKNHYHSSYLGGDTVLCAGSMLIQGGVVSKIRTDSGHYQPTEEHLLNVLHTLRMLGVPLAQLDVESYDGRVIAKATNFINARANWSHLLQRKAANLQHRQARIDQRNQDKWLHDVWLYYKNEANAEQKALAYIRQQMGWQAKMAKDKLDHARQRYDAAQKIKDDRAKKFPVKIKKK